MPIETDGDVYVSQGFLNGLYIVPILAVLILVHEFGHFFAARSVGVRVEEFGIGLPPRAKGWTWKGVLWSLNWIPFGGFVRVLGEDGKNAEPDSMNAKGPLQRAFFLVAGSAMNLLLAVLLAVIVVGGQGIAVTRTYVTDVSAGSPAAEAGWQVGDRIVEVAGAPTGTADALGQRGNEYAGRPMTVVIERDGQRVESTVVPRLNPPAGQGRIGVGLAPVIESRLDVGAVVADSPAAVAGFQPGDRIAAIDNQPITDQYAFVTSIEPARDTTVQVAVERAGGRQELQLAIPAYEDGSDPLAALGLDVSLDPVFERVPAAQVVPRGLGEAWSQTTSMLGGLRDMVTGRADLGQIAGPVGMAQATSEVVSTSPIPLWVTIARLMTLLSLNLAILNLLPLPALDGGRLMFVIVEILRGGRRVAPEREGMVHLAGIVILLGLMFVITVFDIGRLLDGRSLIP